MNTDGHRNLRRDYEYKFIFCIFYHCGNDLMQTFYFPSPSKIISQLEMTDNKCAVFVSPWTFQPW